MDINFNPLIDCYKRSIKKVVKCDECGKRLTPSKIYAQLKISGSSEDDNKTLYWCTENCSNISKNN